MKCKCGKQFKEYKRNGVRISKFCLDCRKAKEKKAREKAKVLKKKARARKKREAKRETNAYWGKKCWKVFTQKMKQEQTDFRGYLTCYTCNIRKLAKEMDMGHCFHRGRGGWREIDFWAEHIHAQCKFCNINGGSSIPIFTANLIRDYGQEFFDKLKKGAVAPAMSVKKLKELYKTL